MASLCVKLQKGADFRKWANVIIKNQRLGRLEQRVSKTEEKIDFFSKTAATIKNNTIFAKNRLWKN